LTGTSSIHEEDAEVKVPRLIRRYWPVLLVLGVAAAWWPALNYLEDFRIPDVPFVTTPQDVVKAMLDLAEVTDQDLVYDLGSGDGRILLAAARDRGARAVGIELDPALVDSSREVIRAAGLTDKVRVVRGDIFKVDFSSATVVTLFLKPGVNVKLRSQFDRLRLGTRIVSQQFSIHGAKPVKRIEVYSEETKLEHPVYLYVAPLEWE
jgi:predicted RNA methylase